MVKAVEFGFRGKKLEILLKCVEDNNKDIIGLLCKSTLRNRNFIELAKVEEIVNSKIEVGNIENWEANMQKKHALKNVCSKMFAGGLADKHKK